MPVTRENNPPPPQKKKKKKKKKKNSLVSQERKVFLGSVKCQVDIMKITWHIFLSLEAVCAFYYLID